MSIRTFLSKHRRKLIIGGIVLLLLIGVVSCLRRPKAPEYLTAPVARGDIMQTVEAVGSVVSERELELRFAGVGIVSQVYVKEGARVVPGTRLAQLRSSGLGATVASQAASLQSALADLRAVEQGNRPEDIAIAEAQVQNRRASLEAAQSTLQTAEEALQQSQGRVTALEQEAQTSLAGQIATARSALSLQLVGGQNALATIGDVFGNTIVKDAVTKFRPGADNDILINKNKALDAIADAQSAGNAATNYQEALAALNKANGALADAQSVLSQAYALIVDMPETAYFKNSDREAHKATLGGARASVQTSASALSSAYSSFQSASATYDTRLTTERSNAVAAQGTKAKAEADIRTFETALRTEEASLALKKAGPRQTDVDTARARVRIAQANLARAQADYADTVLVAPIAGMVTHVNIRIGESLPPGSAISMLGDSPFRVEMFVSEIDIPKVSLTQSGSVELDAFRGTHFQLRVGAVDTASTDKDGVPKYRVKLDFVHPHTELKIGMTGDAEITTGMRTGVLSIPRRAVLEDAEGKQRVRVLQADGTVADQSVTTGMEGGSGDVEILSGLKEGDTVVVLEKK